jgi:hypothetical protein
MSSKVDGVEYERCLGTSHSVSVGMDWDDLFRAVGVGVSGCGCSTDQTSVEWSGGREGKERGEKLHLDFVKGAGCGGYTSSTAELPFWGRWLRRKGVQCRNIAGHSPKRCCTAAHRSRS